MADDDGDVIYVLVEPKLDEAAADEAAEKLSDKFKNSAKNIGESIKDATRGFGDSFKDYLDKDIKDSVKDFGRNLRDELKSGDVKGAFEDIGHSVGNATDMVTSLGEAFGVHLDGVGSAGKTIAETLDTVGGGLGKITDALRAFKSHDVAGGLSGISNILGGVESLDQVSAMAGTVQSLSDALRELAPATAPVLGALGPLGVAFGLTGGAFYTGLEAMRGELEKPERQDYASYLAQGGGKLSADGKPLTFQQYMATSNYSDLYPTAPGVPGLAPLLGAPGADFDASVPGGKPRQPGPNEVLLPIPGGSVGTQGPAQVRAGDAVPAGAPPIASAVTQAQQALVESNTATVTAGSISLGGLTLQQAVAGAAPRTPGGASGGVGGGFGGRPSSATSGTGAMGGLWSTGGILPGASPGYDNLIGALGGRPIGLEGGEFVVNPTATQNNLSLLQAINSGDMMPHFDAGGNTADPSSSNPITSFLGSPQKLPAAGGKPGDVHGQQPGGVQGQQPGGVTTGPSQPAQAPDEPSPPQTIIPQGQGKGFGISGGILGGAESAASSMAPFGSSAAVQIGMQEANKAIETGVKAGITLGVEAPLDTFWLSDSGLSDPSHSWFGKLGLDMIGQTGGLAKNLAGTTQAPLTPGQGQQGQSPLGGQQGQQGGGAPLIHIENQHNASDVDHMNNNQTIAGQVAAYSNLSNNPYSYL